MVNKVFLIGRLGKEPELRYTPTGTAVANFPMATDRKWRDKEGTLHQETDWHNIVIMGKQAEIAASYLKKGSLIFVEGRIQNRSWEDKDGNKHYRTEIVAFRFQMLDKKPTGEEYSQEETDTVEQEENTEKKSGEGVDDDIPF